jgi:phosphate uptake regulator
VFKWLRNQRDGLSEAGELFTQMLVDGRHVFDLAMSVRVGGADPATVSEDLLRTEERTDEAERRIRRLVLLHASVHGAVDLPACLLYMSVAKDAERVADLSKNLYGVGQVVGSPPPGAMRDDFVRLHAEVSPMIVEAASIFAAEDEPAAQRFIERARALQTHTRGRIDELLVGDDDPQPAASVLTYRHIGRIVANLLNITSAVVMPLDQLDYPTPPDADTEEDL